MCKVLKSETEIWTPSAKLGDAIMVRAASPSLDIEAEYWRYIESILSQVEELCQQFPVNIAAWQEDFERLILSSHFTAAQTGRILSGGGSVYSDKAIAATALLDDRVYLAKFKADILRGRYGFGQDWTPNAVSNRMGYYISRARSSASIAFVAGSPVQAVFYWTLTAAESCLDCPRLQAKSPYTAYSLPFHPASGRTQCRTNCQCVLIRSDGVSGVFPPPPQMM